MNQRLPSRLYRTFSTAMCAVLLYSSAAAGINEGVLATTEFLHQKVRFPAKEFTEKPAKVFKGANPRRDETRSSWWTPKLKSDRIRVKLNRELDSLEEAGLYASEEDFSMFLPQGEGNPERAGEIPRVRAEGGSGGAGSSGGGGSETGGGLSGETNTNTGNNLHSLEIVGWSSVGDNGVSLSLYHSSKDDDEGLFGMGWMSTYETRIDYTAGSSAIVKFPMASKLVYRDLGRNVYATGEHQSHPGKECKRFVHSHVEDGRAVGIPRDREALSDQGCGRKHHVRSLQWIGATFNHHQCRRPSSDFCIRFQRQGFERDRPHKPRLDFHLRRSEEPDGGDPPLVDGLSCTRSFTYNSTFDILTEIDLWGKLWSWTYDSSSE